MYHHNKGDLKTEKFTLSHTMYEGGEDTSTFSLISALDGHEWSTPYPSPFTPLERDHVPIVQEAGWAPQPV